MIGSLFRAHDLYQKQNRKKAMRSNDMESLRQKTKKDGRELKSLSLLKQKKMTGDFH